MSNLPMNRAARYFVLLHEAAEALVACDDFNLDDADPASKQKWDELVGICVPAQEKLVQFCREHSDQLTQQLRMFGEIT